MLIEIKVSHRCTDKKITSGAPIIEFDVASEEDVDYIISHDIKESDKVRYYGFNLIRQDTTGLIPPIHTLQRFILYKSGKTFCESIDCQSIAVHKNSSLLEFTTYSSEEQYWKLNLYGLKIARERGFFFPNCYLCEHYCYKEESDCYKCQINDALMEKGSDALNCDYYAFKPSIFDRINSFSFEHIDIWTLTTHL